MQLEMCALPGGWKRERYRRSPAPALPNALRAANDVRFTMIVSLLSMWIFRIGFSYILAIYFNMGILGTWIAMCIDWFCRGACFVIRFARGKWKNISFIDN